MTIFGAAGLLAIKFSVRASRSSPEMRYGAGSQKLIAGQVADLEAEGKNVKRGQLQFIHQNKTAAILMTSVRLGAMSANADGRKLSAITRFGRRLGLAFQIIDDILDVT